MNCCVPFLILLIATVTASTLSIDSQYVCSQANEVAAFLKSSAPGRFQIENAMVRLSGAPKFETSSNGPAPCIIIGTGWWHYELCWMRYLRQFHVEDHRIAAEYFLGLGPSSTGHDLFMSRTSAYVNGDRSVASQLEQMRKTKEWQALRSSSLRDLNPGDGSFGCSHWLDARARILRMSSLTSDEAKRGKRTPGATIVSSEVADIRANNAITSLMTGGTICDVSGQPRKTLVVLTCEHEAELFLGFNVTEEAPCNYVAYVFGASICSTLRKAPLPDGTKTKTATAPSKTQEAESAHEKIRQQRSDASKPQGAKNTAPQSEAAKHSSEAEPRIQRPSRYDRGASKSNDATSADSDADAALSRLLTEFMASPVRGSNEKPTVSDSSKPQEKSRDDDLPPYEGSLIFSLG